MIIGILNLRFDYGRGHPQVAARGPLCAIALAVLLIGGCVRGPYQFSHFHRGPAEDAAEPVEICCGNPNKFLDGLGNIVGIKSKILPFNSEVNNHHITDETLELLVEYLEKNDIRDVYVSVNEYAPKDQWRRMRENTRISPGWKYTIGTLSWLDYTIFPKRVFGGDRYNPYTNSLYVNSNLPAVLIAEAAYAKDIHSRRYPGTYAFFVNDMPVLTIWRRCRAVNDVLGYAQLRGDWELEKQTYHVVYPQIGAATFGEAGLAATGPVAGVSAIFIGPILELGGAGVGHAVGRTVASHRHRQLQQEKLVEEIARRNRGTAETDATEVHAESTLQTAGRKRAASPNEIIPAQHSELDDPSEPR